MAKGKKRGRKQPAWKKWLRAGLSITGTLIGTTVAVSPVIRGVTQMASGQFTQGVDSIVFDTTGMIPSSNHFTPDVSRLIGTGIVVVVGVGISKLFKFLARRA